MRTLAVPLLLMLAASCTTDDPVAGDAGHGLDAALDAARSDAGARDAGRDALVLDDAGSACARCADRRCEEGAARCARSATCLELTACRLACTSVPCLEACEVGHSSEEGADASSLGRCIPDCGIACGPIPPSPRPEGCQPSATPCDPGVAGFDCCAGSGNTCVEPEGYCCADGYCCAAGAQTCNAAHPCCEGTCVDGECVLPTCAVAACTPGGLPCCDDRRVCNGESGVDVCCFPNRAIIAFEEASGCCSSSIESLGEGMVRCIERVDP
jgi:hypothetical protein